MPDRACTSSSEASITARGRCGFSMVYLAITLTVLIGLTSLGVDLGRVQLAKTELRAAADAAVRAAVAKVAKGASDSQVRSEAISWAAYNKVDGSRPVVLQSGDIEIGNWTQARNPQFLVTSTDVNAVRVTAALSAARNTAVPLSFASLIGFSTCDVTAVSIATYKAQGFAVVGLDYIKMGGNTSNSYWSSGGSGTDKLGSIASNGDITLSGSSSISGDARPGVGKTVYGADKVSGSTAPLTSPLEFPNGDAGSYKKFNDNANIPGTYLSSGDLTVAKNQDLTLPGGHYYVRDLTLAAGGNLTFTGETTIYAYGTVDLSGHAVTSGSVPGNLALVMVPLNGTPPGSVTTGSKSAMYLTIYAPQSAVVLSGTGDLYGSMIGKSIDMTGTSGIHYDADIATSTPLITLVK